MEEEAGAVFEEQDSLETVTLLAEDEVGERKLESVTSSG